MKFTLSWLKEHLITNATPAEIADRLTALGLEVESVESHGEALAAFTVAEILEANPHPDADRLRVCTVRTREGERTIVCGAPNARAGIKVALADIGAIIPNGGFTIKKSRIRGVESCGMLCSAKELGLGDDHAGIIELPENAEVGESIVKALGLDDVLFDVAITPDRGDCLGVYGIARDLAASGMGELRLLAPMLADNSSPLEGEPKSESQDVDFGGGAKNPDDVPPTIQHQPSASLHPLPRIAPACGVLCKTIKKHPAGGCFKGGAVPERNIRLETPDCPIFAGRLIRGVKNTESPDWLKRKLKSVGLRPISALVDITNYMTMTYGRPLHVYDADRLTGDIIVRSSREGEAVDGLNDKHYDLPDGLCVIADEAGVLGLGGVLGGEPSGCTETTTNVFLESAWFEPDAVARTGRALFIDSDARYRFERTVDPQFVIPGAEIATKLILELCGGAASELVVAGSSPDTTHVIDFDPQEVALLGGVEIDADEARTILEWLGFRVEECSPLVGDAGRGEKIPQALTPALSQREREEWRVTSPSWRPDMERPADLVEEVLRIRGYDAIPSTPLPAGRDARIGEDKPLRMLRRTLAGRGLSECYHFAFISRPQAERFTNGEPVGILNPIHAEMNTLRPNLLPGLLAACKRNGDRGMEHLALFEAGVVFHGRTPGEQPLMVAGIRTGHAGLHWEGKPRTWDVFDVKADLRAALEALGLSAGPQVSDSAPDWYHPGKSGSLTLGPKKILGHFGELHPAILRVFDIGSPVMAFEVYPAAIPAAKRREATALQLSDYQAAGRDFAFVVDAALPAGDLLAAIRGADRQLIRDVVLFDLYAGKGIPEGRKSLAFSVTLQADDRTLTEEEITAVCARIHDAAKKHGAELRG